MVPTPAIDTYSGTVVLREELNEGLLAQELEGPGLTRPVAKITDHRYFRKEGAET